MKNDVRLKRLKQLKYMLDNHKKLFQTTYFNMNYWVSRTAPFQKTKLCREDACGSAACALGSAALYAPFIKEGLHLWTYKGDTDAEPRYRDHDGFSAGAKFFGIREEESDWLFDPCEYYSGFVDGEDITIKEVSGRVVELIKKYKEAA